MPMLPTVRSILLAAAVASTLTGCPKHVDVESAAAPPAEMATVPGEQLALPVGASLGGEARRLADIYARATWVQTQIAAGAYEPAAIEATRIRELIAGARRRTDLPADVRTKLVALAPLATALVRVAKAGDANALPLAGGLVSGVQAIVGSPDTLAWLGSQGGGGGGAATQAAVPAEPLQLGLGTTLDAGGRRYAEAYARMALAQIRLASGDWNGAVGDLRLAVGMLDSLGRSQDLPPALKAQIADLLQRVPLLGVQLTQKDPSATATIGQLVSIMNRLTLDPTTVAWLK